MIMKVKLAIGFDVQVQSRKFLFDIEILRTTAYRHLFPSTHYFILCSGFLFVAEHLFDGRGPMYSSGKALLEHNSPVSKLRQQEGIGKSTSEVRHYICELQIFASLPTQPLRQCPSYNIQPGRLAIRLCGE